MLHLDPSAELTMFVGFNWITKQLGKDIDKLFHITFYGVFIGSNFKIWEEL